MIFHPSGVRRLALHELRHRWRSGRHLARNDQEKRALLKALRLHLRRLSDARVREQVARGSWVGACLLLGLAAGAVAPPFMLSGRAHPIPEGSLHLFVVWYVVMLVCTAVIVRSMRQRRRIRFILALNLLLVTGWVMLSRVGSAEDTASALNAAAISSVAALVTVLVTVAPRFFAYRISGGQKYLDTARHPDTAFVCELLAVCELIRPPGGFQSVEQKNAIARKIQAAASIAEIELPRSLKFRDYQINRSIEERFRGIAAGLRQAQHWVLFPGRNTLPQLKRRLRKTLQSFASGEWATVPVGPVNSRKRVLHTILSLVGRATTVLIAAVVLVVLGRSPGFQALPLEMRLAVWLLVIGLVAMANPELKEHVNVRKMVADLLISLKPKNP